MLTIATIETTHGVIYSSNFTSTSDIETNVLDEWDPSSFLTDMTGTRLIEEIVRRVRRSWSKAAAEPIGLAVSLPGTLSGRDIITSSSRLGIRQPIAAAQLLTERLGVPCKIYHDVECLAMGESTFGVPESELSNITSAFIFADEGVGSKIIIDGKTHLGAGVAGTIGRLTVQPDGSYYKELAARGPLEVYSSRPWVSENLVATYLSEQGKVSLQLAELEDTPFRRALNVASQGNWRGIDYHHIAIGLSANDPIAKLVLDDAARFLGLAVNSVITIVHPHRIILGGGMMTELPGFADMAISYARRYSWPLAWNRTEVVVSTLGRLGQAHGAAVLWNSQH